MNRMKIFILFVCKLTIFIRLISASDKSDVPAQCYDNTIINDHTRNVNANGDTQCDTMFISGPKWIRFVGEGGTQLSTSPTSFDKCGAQVTGWYQGSMPTVFQTFNDANVCFSWQNDTCHWTNTIAITNCGSFYVYQLSMPPVCPARYCTDTPTISTTTTTTEMSTTTSIPFSFPQCNEHTIIDDPSRNINNNGSNVVCDQAVFNASGVWIRFVGEGGTQIPTSQPAINQCGTNAGGWYSGSMPNSTYSTTNGTVCYTWHRNSCNWRNDIQVTNCGSFYVYRLTRPPGCSLRYCTDTPTISTTTTTTEMSTTTSIPFSFPQCYEHTIIDDPSRSINNNGSNVVCDQTVFDASGVWVRFVGEGGTQIPTSMPADHRCGTYAGGWYSGSMPNTTYSTTNGTVCYSWDGNSCIFRNDIQVTNCGSFYVYRLTRPPGCSLRYCTVVPPSAD